MPHIINHQLNTPSTLRLSFLSFTNKHLKSMSCLSLRLPPARNIWRSLTSKLQSKLHKHQRSKAILKPLKRLNKKTATEQRFKRKKRLVHSYHARNVYNHHQYLFEEKSAPVYVDKLFKEPITRTVELEHAKPVLTKRPFIRANNIKHLDHPGAVPAASKGGSLAEETCSADDMWESVGLASPQMHGINERAEEFIVRFRAEMKVQEMLARRLL